MGGEHYLAVDAWAQRLHQETELLAGKGGGKGGDKLKVLFG